VSDLKDPRVLFAAERTLLAWNRTSLALIAFGFMVERAGMLLKAVSPRLVDAGSQTMTFWIGLSFIALGAFSAVYSSCQYASLLKTLNPAEFPAGYGAKWGLAVNWLVAFLGLALMIVLYLKGV
jgi:putative membrane protein